MCEYVSLVIIIRWGLILLDHYPKQREGTVIVTLIDYFSKWPKAEPLRDKNAEGVALFLYCTMCRWVYLLW